MRRTGIVSRRGQSSYKKVPQVLDGDEEDGFKL